MDEEEVKQLHTEIIHSMFQGQTKVKNKVQFANKHCRN